MESAVVVLPPFPAIPATARLLLLVVLLLVVLLLKVLMLILLLLPDLASVWNLIWGKRVLTNLRNAALAIVLGRPAIVAK